MKKGKFWANFILLVLAGSAVFFIGWVSFRVKNGECGIMETKTGGLYEKPLSQGDFLWRPEALLPTNVTIRTFSVVPYASIQTVSGTLPSGNLYAMYLKHAQPAQVTVSPDFDYRIQCSVSYNPDSQTIYSLYKKNRFKDQVELNEFFDRATKVFASVLLDYSMEKPESAVSGVLSKAQISAVIDKSRSAGTYSPAFDVIDGVEVKSSMIPDFDLYVKARSLYQDYIGRVDNELRSHAKDQALFLMEEDRTMKQLEKFGELLQKYPQLDELSKGGNITEIMNALRTIR